MLMSEYRERPTSKRPTIFTWNANIRSWGAFGSGWTVSTHLIFSRSTDPLRPFRFCLSDGETVRELRDARVWTQGKHGLETKWTLTARTILSGS